MSRGKNICSVDDRRQKTKDSGKMLVALPSPTRAPIGKKFIRQKHVDKTGKLKIITPATYYEQWTEAVLESGIRNIRREYIDLVRNYVPTGTQHAWEDDKNYYKNRYDDVRVLDNTRVILKDTPNKEDYINASYVSVGDDMMLICAQGPMSNTIQDFWLMIVQEDVRVILQLCQFNENGKEQCAEYLPDDKNWKEFGVVRVRCFEKPRTNLQLKKVTQAKVQVSYKDIKHEVMHILYSGWPDHFVAESASTCREVRALVLKYYRKKPIVVHCSAGVGRTGTYAAFEMAIQKIKKNKMLVIPDVARSVRDQRMGAIQNDQQYLFIYRMVLEILIADQLLTKTPEIMDFIREYDDLVRRKRIEYAKKSSKSSKSAKNNA
ncbi:Protein-tyrosine phosphatase family protein [Acanthocheilonema viteae]|uniref:Protein-tyrosine-phosphatase n=1 Tax=Acanthocheilonema viteae TaxID=6277 RepID=A0A498S4J1_ACAVI|nr:unnamed protein product [Acanthocheilonema viteae]